MASDGVGCTADASTRPPDAPRCRGKISGVAKAVVPRSEVSLVKRFLLACAVLTLIALPASATSSPGYTPFLGATDWIHGPVHAADLRGKVVLLEVFTFECINCQHVTPELQKLHASLPPAQFAIVGVHTPELPEERVRKNVVSELGRQGITWPVVIDNNMAIWNAYNNEYWPTQYIFDRKGVLRRTVVGEGQDAVVESTIKALLAEK
jgi:thiol-disulfide isomerase/thioredoxin